MTWIYGAKIHLGVSEKPFFFWGGGGVPYTGIQFYLGCKRGTYPYFWKYPSKDFGDWGSKGSKGFKNMDGM